MCGGVSVHVPCQHHCAAGVQGALCAVLWAVLQTLACVRDEVGLRATCRQDVMWHVM